MNNLPTITDYIMPFERSEIGFIDWMKIHIKPMATYTISFLLLKQA